MDAFAVLEEPRRPWLDPDALKAKFLVLAEKLHPDRVHESSEEAKQAATHRYTAVNAAYQCLREPRDRLRLLLELERGGKPSGIEQVPAATMDLFLRIGQLCRNVDSFLSQRSQVTSPLLKVQMFELGMEWTDQLNELQRMLQAERAALEENLKEMNVAWDNAPGLDSPERAGTLPLAQLEDIYRSLSYLARWTSQCQDRIVQLSL